MEDVLEWFSASRARKACLTVLLAATPHCSPTLFWQPVGQIWVMGGLTNAQGLFLWVPVELWRSSQEVIVG